jgi:hypothetical protein
MLVLTVVLWPEEVASATALHVFSGYSSHSPPAQAEQPLCFVVLSAFAWSCPQLLRSNASSWGVGEDRHLCPETNPPHTHQVFPSQHLSSSSMCCVFSPVCLFSWQVFCYFTGIFLMEKVLMCTFCKLWVHGQQESSVGKGPGGKIVCSLRI